MRDVSHPALTEGALPPEETIAGAFIRNVEGRIADLEATGDDMARREAEELRDVLQLGRLPARGLGGDAVRITSLALTDLRRYRDEEFILSPGLNDRPRPERGRQVDDPAGDRAGADAQGHELGRGPRRAGARGTAIRTRARRSR